jgi:hypothetical protein
MSRTAAALLAVCLLITAIVVRSGPPVVERHPSPFRPALPNTLITLAAGEGHVVAPGWENFLPAVPGNPSAKNSEAFAEWLDTLAGPRHMTALAAVAREAGSVRDKEIISVDPGRARNWSEFSDPYLYLHWKLAGGQTSPLHHALLTKVVEQVGATPARNRQAKDDGPAQWRRLPLHPSSQDTWLRLRY